MPELPDVEVFKSILDANALHQRVESVAIGDARLLRNTSASGLRRALKGRELESSLRHGKYLFVGIRGDGWLVLHFGMTGELSYSEGSSRDPLVLRFRNGQQLTYRSRRRLGKIELARDPKQFIRARRLGPDALALNLYQFESLLAQGRGAIKPFLMNQKHLAGLGNIYVDESLFDARLHPRRQVSSLDAGRRQNLFRSIRKVLKKAIACQADAHCFPRTYLTPHRKAGAECPRCGVRLERTTVGGRTTYFCAREQRAR